MWLKASIIFRKVLFSLIIVFSVYYLINALSFKFDFDIFTSFMFFVTITAISLVFIILGLDNKKLLACLFLIKLIVVSCFALEIIIDSKFEDAIIMMYDIATYLVIAIFLFMNQTRTIMVILTALGVLLKSSMYYSYILFYISFNFPLILVLEIIADIVFDILLFWEFASEELAQINVKKPKQAKLV